MACDSFEHRPIHNQMRVRSTQNPFKSDKVRSGGVMMKDYSYSLFIITLSFFSLTQIRVRLLPNNMGVTEMPMTTCTTLYHMYCVAEPKINHSPADGNHTTHELNHF